MFGLMWGRARWRLPPSAIGSAIVAGSGMVRDSTAPDPRELGPFLHRPPRKGSAVDRQLPELGPLGPLDGEVDDAGRLLEVGRQVGLRPLEVVGLHVRGGRVVLERLDEDVLLRVLEVAGPVEPEVAGLGAGGLGEAAGDLGPVVGVLGPDAEPGGDEDHGHTLTQRARAVVTSWSSRRRPRRRGP